MRPKWNKIVKIAGIAVAGVGVLGFVTMSLWNWLAPAVFGWHTVTFWQALGILVLSKLLFGGVRGRPGHRGRWRKRMMERWERMTPEEREKFQSMVARGCGKAPAMGNMPDLRSEA